MNRPNLTSTITLEFTWTQLRCVELGVSAFLRELAERPATASERQRRAELTALRAQIDNILTARVAELRAYDEEHQRQGQNTT